MQREIVEIPRALMRATTCDWDIDWRGQSAGEGNDGEQIVYNRQPRFVGSPPLVLRPDMIGHWRALRMRAQGRVNAWRVPMIDPAVQESGGQTDWQAYLAGHAAEHRPTVTAIAAVAAGATEIMVDETTAAEPIRVGAYLSHDDWPFGVTGRSGSGASTVLTVVMLRRAIPMGAAIDLFARGLFIATDDRMGNPAYDLNRVARPQLSFIEWITRT